MTRVQRGIAFAAALLLFGGCGAQTLVQDVPTTEATASTDASIDAPPEASTEVRTESAATPDAATPAPLPVTTPPPAFVDLTVSPVDPFGFPLLGLTDTPDLLSVFSDFLVLDLLTPTPRGGFADDYTYLELLCLDGDDPDFVCRQRYGP